MAHRRVGLQLQPDDEQQQHDAELGEVQDLLGLVVGEHAPDRRGTEQNADDEVAQHAADAEPAGERTRNRERGQQNGGLLQRDARHLLPFPLTSQSRNACRYRPQARELLPPWLRPPALSAPLQRGASLVVLEGLVTLAQTQHRVPGPLCRPSMHTDRRARDPHQLAYAMTAESWRSRMCNLNAALSGLSIVLTDHGRSSHPGALRASRGRYHSARTKGVARCLSISSCVRWG